VNDPASWIASLDLGSPALAGALLVLLVALVAFLITKPHVSTTWVGRSEARRARLLASGLNREVEGLPSSTRTAALVEELKLRDPAFSVPELEGRARRVFDEVRRAVADGDLARARPMLTDHMYQRLCTEQRLRELGGTRRTAEREEQGCKLASLASAGSFDGAHVGMAFAKGGHLRVQPDMEVWSFLRRVGARTRGRGVLDGICPNCGAPFRAGATGRCDHCSAVVNSGNFDWVLAKATRLEDFWVTGEAAPGLTEAQRRDPCLAAEIVEDRAALLFWRYVESLALEDCTRLRKVATSEEVDGLAKRFAQAKADGVREWYSDVTLRSVDLLALDTAGPGGDFAHVRVHWARCRAVSGRASLGKARPTERTGIVVLGRKSEALTDRALGVLTYRCWKCQAPLTDSDSTTCDHCGAEQADGAHHWRLTAFQNYELWVARRKGPRANEVPFLAPGRTVYSIERPSEARRLLHLCVAVARVDGNFAAEERAVLEAQAERWGVAAEDLHQFISDPDFRRSELPVPEEGPVFLAGLAEIIAADGRIDDKERRFMERLARNLDISPDDVRKLLEDAVEGQAPLATALGRGNAGPR
jgi:uncharacterized tellurite resistance protein B-like protein